MASIYRKKGSPFWFIQFIDGDGNRRNKFTELRSDDPTQTIKARAMRATMEAKELSRSGGPLDEGGWDSWVLKFLERHCESPRTHERYLDAWKWLAFWLQAKRFNSPRAITYRNALEYIEWRTHYKKKTGKTVGRNTAIFELKTFAMIMGEAVRLGHADANPLVSLKLKRDKPAKKPELTDDEISAIREALAVEPEWMQTAFEIALHTGCRLRETRLPLSCIDFRENKMTFLSPKGGEIRGASAPSSSL
jgi:hypothetical protein